MAVSKRADVAGTFYPADAVTLENAIAAFEKSAARDYGVSSRAVIAPHAGLAYSGGLAVKALQYLDSEAKNIFILSPAHRLDFDGIAVCDYENFETPLGPFAVNGDINGELVKNFGCKVLNDAFAGEHGIEVHLPLLCKRFAASKIVPLVIGNVSHERVAAIIGKFWRDLPNVFIISSDLSHFHTYAEAEEIDSITCDMVENCDIEKFSGERACGATAIRGMLAFAVGQKFSLIRVGTCNSGDCTGNRDRVVGYGAWMLAGTGRNAFLHENFSERIVAVCRDSIASGLKNEKMVIPADIPCALQQIVASFVTLEIDGVLRGCIGSIHAHYPLVSDLIHNAHSAAFHDFRFSPLTDGEFEKIDIGVSLLSRPTAMKFGCEDELLSAITPGIDGIIIRDGRFQAVYLPSVWEQLPDKEQFLRSLKAKAGLPRDHFSKTFEAFKFSSEYIK